MVAGNSSARFLSRCYSTVLICTPVVLGSGAWYSALYHDAYTTNTPAYLRVELAIGAILLAITVLAAVFRGSDEKLEFFGFDLKVSSTARSRLLPLVTVALVGTLAAMCAVTSGAQSSPFSPYLVGVSSLAIVFARRARNRLLIVIISIAGYLGSSWFYLQPQPVPTKPAAFDASIVVIAIIFAAIAAWHGPGPEVQSQPGSLPSQ